MSLLLPLHAYAGHEGKSRATGGREKQGMAPEGGGPLTCAFTNALLVPHKLRPRHLVSFHTFVSSVSSLLLPAVCLSNHRFRTAWVNEGLGSTLTPPGISSATKRQPAAVVGYSSEGLWFQVCSPS